MCEQLSKFGEYLLLLTTLVTYLTPAACLPNVPTDTGTSAILSVMDAEELQLHCWWHSGELSYALLIDQCLDGFCRSVWVMASIGVQVLSMHRMSAMRCKFVQARCQIWAVTSPQG